MPNHGAAMKAISHAFISLMASMLRLTGSPSIESIETRELERLLDSDDVVLVDVRSEAERSVSMIPGAVSKEQFEDEADQYRDRTIVPYCTVGGRALLYARKLAKQGFDTRCHRESILGWCDAELPLVDAEGNPTNRVHVVMKPFRVPARYEAVTKA
ncbi:MAG: rhodanese-like domain-containing protein [Planctomycetota bacterium]